MSYSLTLKDWQRARKDDLPKERGESDIKGKRKSLQIVVFAYSR